MDNRLSAGLNRQGLFFGCLLTGLLLCWGMSPLHAQDAASGGVSGIVRTEQGDPLSGITVVATNLSTHLTAGTMTDTTGLFHFPKLPANGKYSFTFSGVGFESQMLAPYNLKESGLTSILVRLKVSNNPLNEVVVVGYGTQKQAKVTGAVAQISGDVLSNRAIPNVSQGLQGEVAGLNMVMFDGKPIQSPQFNVRGTTSIGAGGGASLVLIDGIEGDPSLVNPNDIATVSRERGTELCLEGFRFADLARWNAGDLMNNIGPNGQTNVWNGMYVPALNVRYDLDQNGAADVCFYQGTQPTPTPADSDVLFVNVSPTISTGTNPQILANGTYGELNWLDPLTSIMSFQSYMYIYPIPYQEIELNPNLGQNPGWK